MPTTQPVVSMGAFPSDTVDRVWVLPFGLTFDQAILNPQALNYDLQIDTQPNFASANSIWLTKTSADPRLINFQEGNGVGKAFEVLMPGRALQGPLTWYWRVRIDAYPYLSPWSDTRTFVVTQRQDLAQTQSIYSTLADENSYSKEANSANTYKMLLQVGRELDLLLQENGQAVNDLSLDMSRDTALVNNFSDYLGLVRSAADVAANHRWRTRKLWKAFVNYPGTFQGMLDSVQAFVAEPPSILDLTATQGWILGVNFIGVPGDAAVTPPIVLLSRPQKGNAFGLTVFNSWDLTYDPTVMSRFTTRMQPAQSNMTVAYSSVRHWSSRYNLQADWSLWTSDGNSDLTTYPNCVAIKAGATSTTLTSQVINIPTVTGYGSPLITTTLSGQTVSLYYRTSPDGQNWSSYTPLQFGVTPGNQVPIAPYMQFQATLSRTNAGAPTPLLNSFEFIGTRS